MYSVTQLCLTLCSSMDYSPPGSSVNGLLQANWNGLPFSIPRDLNNPGIQPMSLSTSPELVGRFFTTRANRRKIRKFSNVRIKEKITTEQPVGKKKKKKKSKGE